MRNLFVIQSKNPHPACLMQETICTCKENYNGETKRNAGIEWVEDSGVKGISEPSRHLKRNPMLTLT